MSIEMDECKRKYEDKDNDSLDDINIDIKIGHGRQCFENESVRVPKRNPYSMF
jgi:hypothetical protein